MTAVLAGLAAFGAANNPVSGRVGVTSETNGDPLGKPPTEAERVLRVGIDIQADEVITTRENDRAHLVFLDGTALTVSPNAQIKVDRFVYDPQAHTGKIAITASKGVFRLVGGKISKTTPITVTTPSSTIGIRGGIGVFAVDGSQTTAQFLFGNSLTVTANGQTQTAIRPGSEIRTTNGSAPGIPTLIPPGGMTRVMQVLEAPRGTASSRPVSADEQAKRSGFSEQNSGRSLYSGPIAGRVEALSQSLDAAVTSQARPLALAPQPSASMAIQQALPSGGAITGGTSVPSVQPGCYDDRHDPHRFHHHHRH
jgi:hypothetical protein